MKIINKDMHWGLVLSVFLSIIAGCIIIFSASKAMNPDATFLKNLAVKQFIFASIISIAVLIIFTLDLKFISDISWFFYFLSLGSLIAVFVIGKASHGAQRWISLGPLALQPSEFAKIALILALAKFMSINIANSRKVYFILISSIITIIPLGFIVMQPDLGTSLTFLPILISMLFMAGIKKRYFLMLFPFALIPLLIIYLAKQKVIDIDDIRSLLPFLKTYQQNRLLAFIDPSIDPSGISYQLKQSQIAIGSGQLFGKGFLNGSQTHLYFLPERHTDFVFSVLGEEWGFIGGSFLILLYLYILKTGLSIANQSADFFAKLASIGIVILLLSHIITNIGMTIGLMPITGLPLPLISYGGSSLLTSMISIGLLLNFYANRNHALFR